MRSSGIKPVMFYSPASGSFSSTGFIMPVSGLCVGIYLGYWNNNNGDFQVFVGTSQLTQPSAEQKFQSGDQTIWAALQCGFLAVGGITQYVVPESYQQFFDIPLPGIPIAAGQRIFVTINNMAAGAAYAILYMVI